jgi:hypothetical protein
MKEVKIGKEAGKSRVLRLGWTVKEGAFFRIGSLPDFLILA